MKALQIEKHGPASDLRVVDVPEPFVSAGEVRVEVHAAGINPSDVGSALGAFPNSPLPRILGRDFAGRVVEGPTEWIGEEVWGSGGDLGISRDGTHAEQIVLPVSAVVRRPQSLSVEDAAAAGVAFVTAWAALVDAGRLEEGEWVIVSGAAGAVGGAAIEIAKARGANIVALVRDGDEAERLDRDGVAAVADSDSDNLVDVVREATGGSGADLALNGVGGAIHRPLLDALADGGRLAVYAAMAGREVQLDLFQLYRRHLTFTGVNTVIRDATDCARILTTLAPLFERGTMRVRQQVEHRTLADAAEAYAAVANGTPAKLVFML